MRRVMLGSVVGIVVGVACTLLVVRSGQPAALAEGEPHAGSGFCMDANGDGLVNIADATYTLGYLFLGEPASVDCSTPPHEAPHLLAEIEELEAELAHRGSLPATGQAKCYDASDPANELPCDNADFPGQDGAYQAGCPSEGRFVDNQDGTVTDNCTGLVWQKNTADVNGDGRLNPADLLNWQGALKYCESLSFAGHDDWRLPNVRELQSIVDYGRYEPAIDPVFGAESGQYCSSSSDADDPVYAWGVNFNRGYVSYYEDKDGQSVVRAVRNAP